MIESPCINICEMDEASGWCRGCLRTLDEIAFWSVLDDEDKLAVKTELDKRRVQVATNTGPGQGGAVVRK